MEVNGKRFVVAELLGVNSYVDVYGKYEMFVKLEVVLDFPSLDPVSYCYTELFRTLRELRSQRSTS